jgi:DNA-binding response OmpR family regulator
MRLPERILLIDDDPDDQLFFRDAIQVVQPGLQCEVTSNCNEAFKHLELPPPPDFIFMDLNIPIMNGFECLVYLKNQTTYKDIPVIIFTTSKNLNDISKTRQLGAKWFMTKPDDFKVLCKKLRKVFLKDSLEGVFTI